MFILSNVSVKIVIATLSMKEGVMKRVFPVIGLIIALSLLNAGGCGGGGGGQDCDFNLNRILNGPDFDTAHSEWICDTMVEFALYADGTGIEPFDIGFFTYQRSGCRSLDFQADEGGSGSIINLDGSRDSDFLSFDLVSEDFGNFPVNCTLNIFVE